MTLQVVELVTLRVGGLGTSAVSYAAHDEFESRTRYLAPEANRFEALL